jgi:hypothetical protein
LEQACLAQQEKNGQTCGLKTRNIDLLQYRALCL